MSMSAAFDKLDTNHDGVVSRAEFNQGAAAQQGGVQYMTTYGEPVASAGGPTVTYAGASGMAYATAPGVTYAAAQQGVQYATTYGEPVGSAGHVRVVGDPRGPDGGARDRAGGPEDHGRDCGADRGGAPDADPGEGRRG
eukprot:CAMPEP_0179308302 /NCGR_PEP_ID=MMETSP0797-20121207/51077_1 /TAXON_ID=47934 /ORGANISM="Dinophysis acuminata, Strain DAEP01" /LENGTH=138 /DNA_ID=CAMNT_0021017993 /DNA_START=54 /DNA_END=467 /DNA_ORIENTATION=+